MTNSSFWWLFIIFALIALPVLAQDSPTPTPTLIPIEPLPRGAAPRADFITVTPTETPFVVIVAGSEGATFPSAQVAVRNLYTGDVTYGQANFNGSFSLTTAGLADMPYQVQTATVFDQITPPENLEGVGVIVHPRYQPTALAGTAFAIGGTYAYDAGTWLADGTLNTLTPDSDDDINLTLNVSLFDADIVPNQTYRFRGQLALRRIFDENGVQLSTARNAGSAWSSERTTTNIPIIGREVPDILLSETVTDQVMFKSETGVLSFTFFFGGRLPADMPAGIYMPVLIGQVSIGDSAFETWQTARLLSTNGERAMPETEIILPLIMPIGDRFGAPTVELQFFEPTPYRLPENRYLLTPQLEAQRFLPQVIGLPYVIPFESFLLEVTRREHQLIIIDDLMYADTGDTFAVAPQDTQVTFTANGIMADVFQNPYLFAENVQVSVANPLVLHHSLYTGTPLSPVQAVPVAGMITPPQEATLQLDINSTALTTVTQLQTNRFGYYYAPPLELSAGEYRFDWQVQSFFNPYATLATQAGVVVSAPDPTNGVRGFANYDRDAQAWFDSAIYPDDAPSVLPFVNFPFYSGDVAFLPDSALAGVRPILGNGIYQYLSVVRPDIIISDTTRHSDSTIDVFINNEDLLDSQIGAGITGNRREDVLWLFGGAVDDTGQTSGYSAVAIVADEDASARVVPPFTEPLLTDFDVETATQVPVDMLVQATSVQAGQVLEIGDTLALSGYVAPTVPADIITTMITPTRRIIQNSSANAFGMFYSPANDLTVTETGRYRIYLDASYGGQTSAGLLPDLVRGEMLGAEQGMWIFVVDPAAPMLTTPRESISIVGVGGAVTINVRAPETWTDTTAYAVARTPQWILEQVELDTFANQTNYTFNRPQIATRYANLEANGRAPSDSDEIIITLAITGTDANGVQQTQARMFTLRGETLFTFGD
ncbi:MAG: hypothetical protein AAFQ07_01965 [Chloroflexota bacterium]